MKKIKIFLLLLTVSLTVFYSCTDSNDPIENEVVMSKSISLRTTLNEIRKANNISGKNGLATQDQAFCFSFVFPLNLAYNNGTAITVTSNQGLIEILSNETNLLYIEEIGFPFQVQQEGTTITIENEAGFYALILDCNNFQTVNDCVFDIACYQIVFPIAILDAQSQTVEIQSQAELMEYVTTSSGNPTYQLNIVFPISIVQNDQTILVGNLYEFFAINNDCDGNDCVCPAYYNPVCVQTTSGTVQYSNPCFAECAGFTAADFVNCDPNFNFATALGTCFTITYPVQIQHQGALVTVQNNDDLLLYFFPNQSNVPAFVYPVDVLIDGAAWSFNFDSQADFEYYMAFCD